MKRLNRDKRNYIILGLCAVLILMVVGYASFAQELTKNGTAGTTSTWDVHIKNDPPTGNDAVASIIVTLDFIQTNENGSNNNVVSGSTCYEYSNGDSYCD